MGTTRMLALSLSVLVAAGCTLTTMKGRTLRVGSDAYSAYVEQVFREQNRVASQLAFALVDLGDTSGARYRALTRAEDRLFAACARLNELAARRRDGQPISLVGGLRAAHSAPACERAAQAARAILQHGSSQPPSLD